MLSYIVKIEEPEKPCKDENDNIIIVDDSSNVVQKENMRMGADIYKFKPIQ